MSSKCCKCTTNYSELLVYATFYLQRYGRDTFSGKPNLPEETCRYKFDYIWKAGPQDKYLIENKVLCYRSLYLNPTSKCDCTYAEGGVIKAETLVDSLEHDSGFIYKKFFGTWYSFGPCPSATGKNTIRYKKILKFDTYISEITNEHFCGDDCPSVPWPDNRNFNKVDTWKQFAANY
jgi:hypothetical protein